MGGWEEKKIHCQPQSLWIIKCQNILASDDGVKTYSCFERPMHYMRCYERVSRNSVPFLWDRRALNWARLCSPAACWGVPRSFVHDEGFTIILHNGLCPWSAAQLVVLIAVISGTVRFRDVCWSYPLNLRDWWAFTVMAVHLVCGGSYFPFTTTSCSLVDCV